MLRCCGERNTARKIGEALITEKLAQTLMNEVELALKKRRLGPDETRLRCRREGSKRMALEIDINDVKKFGAHSTSGRVATAILGEESVASLIAKEVERALEEVLRARGAQASVKTQVLPSDLSDVERLITAPPRSYKG